jgi:hypothetical protein
MGVEGGGDIVGVDAEPGAEGGVQPGGHVHRPGPGQDEGR